MRNGRLHSGSCLAQHFSCTVARKGLTHRKSILLKHLSFLCLPHRGSPNGALWTLDKPPLTLEEGISLAYHAKQHKRRVDLYNTQDMLTLSNKVI